MSKKVSSEETIHAEAAPVCGAIIEKPTQESNAETMVDAF
jgi:hypothetical protein